MNLSEITIGYDLDGVIVNPFKLVIAKMNARLNTHYSESDFKGWYWVRDETLRLTNSLELANELEGNFFNSAILRQSPPYFLAVPIIRFFHLLGLNQRFVTSREPSNAAATADWFDHHLPFALTENRLRIRNSDSRLTGDEFKIETILPLRPNRFFEDKGETVEKLQKVAFRPIRQAARLVDRPWNQNFTDLDPVRIHGWFQIISENIKAIKEAQKRS